MFVPKEQDGRVERVLVGHSYSGLFDEYQDYSGGEDEDVQGEGL